MILLKNAKDKVKYNSKLKYKSSIYNVEVFKNNQVLVYNSFSNSVIFINANKYKKEEFTDREISILVNNGFLVSNDENELEKTINEYNRNNIGQKKIKYFTILPTTCCNAKCFYCYEEEYKKYQMDKNVQEKVTNLIAKNVINQNSFILDLYGGEPLLSSIVIDNILEQLDKKIDLSKYNWSSWITTNAVLFDREMIYHAINKWHLRVAHITIDGTEEEHNLRKRIVGVNNAYKKVLNAIELLLKEGVFVNLRIHLDKNNIDSIKQILEGILFLTKYSNFRIYPTYLFPHEHEINSSYFIGNEKKEMFKKVFLNMRNMELINDYLDILPNRKSNICFATEKNNIIISNDGKIYRCVQELENQYSNQFNKFDNPFVKLGKCTECTYFPICLGGCIHNKHINNTMRESCVRNKYIVEPLLELKLQELLNNDV